jgi:multiple antibiotic resistance protein
MKMLAMAFSLFLLMDSIGNIPLFISILKGISRKRQLQIIFREMLIALGIMILFNFLGDYLLAALQVTQYTVLISGGIILFLIALKMIFPVKDSDQASAADKEPFIVPLAVPLVAGPAVLAAIILYSGQETGALSSVLAIIAAWIVTTLILLSSTFLNKIMGTRGIAACERLMGLVLTMIAIQMFLEGLAQFLSAIHPS